MTGKRVVGRGPKPARVMLIGEGPGEHEALSGVAFSGRSGADLDTYLMMAGMSPGSCFVRNMVDYRTDEKNRDPTKEEIARDWPSLLADFADCEPRVVGTIGRVSTRHFLGDVDMDEVHGITYSVEIAGERVLLVPLYHPAAGMRSPEFGTKCLYDFQMLGRAARGETSPFTRGELSGPTVSKLVTTYERMRSIIAQAPKLYIDTEGNYDEPWCLSVSVRPGEGWVVLAEHKGPLLAVAEAVEDGAEVVMHNAMYDHEIIEKMLGVRIRRMSDTMIKLYMFPSEPQGLKEASFRHFGVRYTSYKELTRPYDYDIARGYLIDVFGKKWSVPPAVKRVNPETGRISTSQKHGLNKRVASILKAIDADPEENPRTRWFKIDASIRAEAEAVLGPMPKFSLDDVPFHDVVAYAGADADNTCRLDQVLDRMIEEDGEVGPVLKIDTDIIPMVAKMQRNGFAINRHHFEEMEVELANELADIEDKLAEFNGGEKVNPNSGNQVAELLFGRLGLLAKKRTKSGARESTDDKTLEALRRAHPAVPLILDYRERSKMLTSFVQVIPEMADADDRIRCTLRVTRTTSGRLAASNPNLMAIPIRSKLGKRFRDGFVAPPGRVLAVCDLDQIEMRGMAHESNDKDLIDLIKSGRDIHTENAARMFHIPVSQVKRDTHRYAAKRTGFGVITGISDIGLLDQMELAGIYDFDRTACARLIDEWFKMFPGVAKFMEDCRREGRRNGFVRDMWGRIRYVPGIRSDLWWVRAEAERWTHSHKIQSGAQGIIKRAMKRFWDRYYTDGGLWEPLLQIHDELDFEILAGREETFKTIANECMTADSAIFKVPILTQCGFGRTWGEVEK